MGTNDDRRQSVRQKTYADLKGMILSGEVRPSERLSENGLAQRLGVSRTPLREALMKLEKEGLVIGQRNLGYRVADLDIAAVCDLLVVREALDACAAELACAAATDDDMIRIRGIMDELTALHAATDRTTADEARELDLGLEIHGVIAAATRNAALIRVSEQIYQQLRLALWLEVLWVDLGDTAISEHRAITDAIVARDGPRAAAAAREHVRSSLRNMKKVQQVLRHQRGRRGSDGLSEAQESSGGGPQ
ncbi:GntR family transcriptional regulator [Methylobacterium oryzisoli]|uniref:GntR family transcriptional regulator n=1 Tax=Methylobacterium oryzisoli TaxID=3385502 RepID=UPI003892A5D4